MRRRGRSFPTGPERCSGGGHSTSDVAGYFQAPQYKLKETPEEWKKKHALEPWRILFPRSRVTRRAQAGRIESRGPEALQGADRDHRTSGLGRDGAAHQLPAMQPPLLGMGIPASPKEAEGEDHTPQSDGARLLLSGVQATRDGAYFGHA